MKKEAFKALEILSSECYVRAIWHTSTISYVLSQYHKTDSATPIQTLQKIRLIMTETALPSPSLEREVCSLIIHLEYFTKVQCCNLGAKYVFSISQRYSDIFIVKLNTSFINLSDRLTNVNILNMVHVPGTELLSHWQILIVFGYQLNGTCGSHFVHNYPWNLLTSEGW